MIRSSWPPTSLAPADLEQDLVRRDAEPLGRPLGVQEERRVDAGVAEDERRRGRSTRLAVHAPARRRPRRRPSARSTSIAGLMPSRSKTAASTSVGVLPAPAPSAARASRRSRSRRPRSAASELATPSAEVLVAVEADLRVGAELVAQRRDPRRARRRGSARRPSRRRRRTGAGVGHDPRLLGQLLRLDHVGHHQEADGLEAELAGQREVLARRCRPRCSGWRCGRPRRRARAPAAGRRSCRCPGSSSDGDRARARRLHGGRAISSQLVGRARSRS